MTAGNEASPSPAPIRLAATAGRDLTYLLGVLGMSIAGFVVWVTGVSVTAGLLVLIVGASRGSPPHTPSG